MKFLKIFIVSLVVILIMGRVLMPQYLLKYVETKINAIPQYRVKIEDLDIHLYRGSYTLKNIALWKITNSIPVPFYEAKAMNFSIEWKSLLHGKIVAKIILDSPKINFVTDPNKNNEQVSINSQWLDVVKNLYPLNINKLTANHMEIKLISYHGNPPYQIYIKNADFVMENMQKVLQKNKLLSSNFHFFGSVMSGGSVDLQGQFDPFSKLPTFNLQFKLTNLNVADMGKFLKHYTAVDATAGDFSLYGETAAADGKVRGYIKPFIKYLKVGGKPNQDALTTIVNGAVSVVSKILENPEKKTIATRINITGKIDDPNTSVLSIIGYLLRHGFLEALLPQIDHTIKIQDIVYK